MKSQGSARARRRRRELEAAEGEILDAAQNFLKERPFYDMTVHDIMARTGLSRPSFYEYFRDRNQLILKLTQRLGSWTYSVEGGESAPGADPLAELRMRVERLLNFHAEHGYLLRTLAQAGAHSRQAEVFYGGLLDRFVSATSAHIHRGIENGSITGLNPDETAAILVFANERYLTERLHGETQPDRKVAAEALFTVWKRVLYGI